jgi:hypothetical protein
MPSRLTETGAWVSKLPQVDQTDRDHGAFMEVIRTGPIEGHINFDQLIKMALPLLSTTPSPIGETGQGDSVFFDLVTLTCTRRSRPCG